ncbi:MAG: pentapeptide repeat-containing protein, partial [Pseudomonadota bacterium]
AGAQLQGANLAGAQLQGANLAGAQLQGADLAGAQFDSATNLSAATLRGAALRLVDFRDVPQIEAHIEDVFGDASVKLPNGVQPSDPEWPAHWSKEELDWQQFDKAWRTWQATLPPGWDQPDD